MKIHFSNLGTIRETEIDLRPLTVIIGPNNSSKTYLAYSVYGLLQAIRDAPEDAFERLRSVDVDPEHGSVEWSLRRLDSAFRAHLQSSCKRFAAQLGEFFQDSSNKLFGRTEFRIDVGESTVKTALLADETDHFLAVAENRARLNFQYTTARRVFPALHNDRTTPYKHRFSLDETITLLGGLMSGGVGDVIPTPFILPAERNALIITYKVLSNRRFKLLRDAARNRRLGDQTNSSARQLLRVQGEIRYPLPVEDFLDFLADVELPSTRAEGSTETVFYKLAATVEASLQSGNRLELAPTVLGGSELRVGVGDGLSIDLYNASSSIKQLSALILYLRYKAAPGQLLIIDEPEMNLHPASQVRLLEVLAILVKLGVRVLVTTHSPYLMAHLANLVQSADDARTQKKQAAQLYLKDPRALLSIDEIGAYEMRDNKLVSLKDPEFGLRWDTLSDVFSDLQQRFFALDGLAHGKRRK